MKRKIVLIILFLMILTLTGCGLKNKSNKSSNNNAKEYKIDGVTFKLDSEDSRSKMKYLTSKSFEKKNGSSTTTYYLYYDNNKDKYDVSNIVFSVSVTANIMQTSSNLEYDIKKLDTNSSLQNITREKKTINGITWDYVSLDNYYQTGSNIHFNNHSYYYETFDGTYYTTYIVSFNKTDNIAELENDFLNSIVFE